MGGCAWVTLATNDSYSLGALVLAHSLKQVGTVHQLAVLVTPGVTGIMREKLATVFNVVREVNVLDSRDEANLRLLKRPELGITFTKLHCWRLTQFEKCVFLDADTMVLGNADELFDRDEFSAAPDVGWPDCFNSGVFVYRPSEETYSKLVQFAIEKGSFDGGDQGLLNLYFSDWAHKDISKHLPFIYNMCSTACYSYLPAFKQFGPTVKIIHFIGNTKPWLQYFDTETQHVQVVSDIQHLQGVVQQWWNIFCSCIHPMLSPDMAGLAGAFARLTLGVARTPEQAFLEDQLRRQGWEVGNIDYMGRDSFDNIWSKICETLNSGASAQSYAPPPPADPTPVVAAEPIAAKQADPEPVQEPIAISEQKTAVERKPEPSAGVPAQVAPSSPTSVVSIAPTSQSQPAVPVTEPCIPLAESITATVQPIVESPKPAAQPQQSVTQPPQLAPQLPQPITQPLQPAPQPPLAAPQPPQAVPQPPQTAPQPPKAAPQPPQAAPQAPLPVTQTSQPAPHPPQAAPQPPKAAPQPQQAATEPPQPVTQPPQAAPQTPQPAPHPPQAAPQPPQSAPQSPQAAPQVPQSVTQPPQPISKPQEADILLQKPSTPATPVPSTKQIASEPRDSDPISQPLPQPASPESKPHPTKPEQPKSEPPKQAIPTPIQTESKISTPESPKPQPTVPEQPKPQLTSEQQPPKPAVASIEPKKSMESPKPASPASAKPKKEPNEKTTPPTKSEQASGQKPVSRTPPKEAVQAKSETPNAEGPTPPPRKAAGGQASGGKKPAKGKK